MSAEIIDRLQVAETLWQSLQERKTPPPQQNDNRQFPRRCVLTRAVMEYCGGLPAHPRRPQRHSILLVDLSRRGLRFLHSEQIFPGERAEVHLTDQKQVHVETVRCRKIAESCYEVGVKFTTGGAAGEQDATDGETLLNTAK